jgi:hypothetical protein
MSGARLPAGALAVACAGCFQVSMSDVLVRDPSKVSLRAPEDGHDVLAPDRDEGVVASGKYWDMLSRVPYVVRARREEDGAIALHCEACGDVGYPYSGRPHTTLLDANGRSLPTTTWSLHIAPSEITADYDVCMVDSPDGCELSVPTRLAVPMSDVVEVHRRVEPVRIWGYALLAMSAIGLVTASAYTFAPSGSTSFSDRWPMGVLVAIPALGFGGVGLWEVLTPTRDQVWTPPK